MSAYILDFTKPPSVYSLAYADFPTVVYNATEKSLDITGSSTNHQIVLATAFPAGTIGSEIVFEADIELLSDASGRRIVGLALVDPATISAGYYSGPECSSLDSGWRALHRNAWMNADVEYASLATASPNYDVGSRHVLKFVRNGLHFDFYVDDVLMLAFDDTIVREPTLLPAIIVFACAIRVRSFKYTAQIVDDVAITKSVDIGTIRGVRILTSSISAMPYRELYGYIEGTVENSGVPVPDQRVACFDNSHNLIDEVKSGSDGSYRFDNLPRLNGDTYVVMARDSNGLLSPATADNRIPEAYS